LQHAAEFHVDQPFGPHKEAQQRQAVIMNSVTRDGVAIGMLRMRLKSVNPLLPPKPVYCGRTATARR
jgi:hypothetical protein